MADDKPKGWHEPVVEALWTRDLTFGVPKFCIAHWLVWFAVCMIIRSVKPLWPGIAVQVVLMGLTAWDAEWPELTRDFFKHPDELDP